jgi:hypothetical protein
MILQGMKQSLRGGICSFKVWSKTGQVEYAPSQDGAEFERWNMPLQGMDSNLKGGICFKVWIQI